MQKQEKEANAQEKEEGTWLVDTERLAAYPDLYMTDVRRYRAVISVFSNI